MRTLGKLLQPCLATSLFENMTFHSTDEEDIPANELCSKKIDSQLINYQSLHIYLARKRAYFMSFS